MRTWKKAISVLLSLAMLLSLCVVGASAEGMTAESLQVAISKGGTVTLENDVDIGTILTVEKDVVLDLGGFTLTGRGSRARMFNVNAGTLTVKNGTITTDADKTAEDSVIRVTGETGTCGLVVEADATVSTTAAKCYAVSVWGNDASKKSVTVNGTLSGTCGALSGNGSANSGNTEITVNSGAILEASEADSIAIYHPQDGTLTINGGTITGASAIEAKSGNTVISISGNPVVTATGTTTHKPNGNGNSTVGYAVALVHNTAYSNNAAVSIASGTYTGAVGELDDNDTTKDETATGKLSITGGTFSSDPSAYVASGMVASKSGDVYTVGAPVAKIEETSYSTLAAAVEAATTSSTTIQLLSDVTLMNTLTISDGKAVILDLNGHMISKNNRVIMVEHGSLDIIGRGTIQETANDGYGAINIKGSDNQSDTNYTNVTIGKDVTLRGWAGMFITPYASSGNPHAYGVTVNFNGTIYTPAQNNHTAEGHGIYLNGQIRDKTNYPVINIGTTAKVNARLGGGIYAAGYAEWNIADGANITGLDYGIGIKAGKLNIDGGTIDCAGPNTAPTSGYSNGINASGAAIQIESNSDYAGGIDIDISNGTLTSANGYSIYEYIGKGAVTAVTGLNITGGVFQGGIMTSGELAELTPAVFSISGGTFSSDPSAYVAAGYSATTSGNQYVVGLTPADTLKVAAPVVEATVDSAVPETKIPEVTAVASKIEIPAISAVVPKETMTAEEVSAAKTSNLTALKQATNTTDLDVNTVNIVTVPTLDVAVKSVSTDASGNITALKVDITPMVQTVATTAAATDDNPVVLSGDLKNAVAIGTPQVVTVTVPVTVTIPLPKEFAEVDTTIYVKHEAKSGTYTYATKVQKASDDSLFVQFTNEHGFSGFTVQTTDDSAARIGTVGYTSLQAAVDAVANNGTITVLGDNLSATVSKTITFTVTGKAATITAGNNTTLTKTGSSSPYTYTFVYTTPQGSTGGGSGATTYSVTVSSATNGTVKSNVTNAAKGAKVTLTATPATGYTLDTLTVKDASGNSISTTKASATTYTFTMPASKVTVSATFKASTTAMPFTDVASDYWAYSQIEWAYNNGYMNGKTPTTFVPAGTVTRQQLWMVLARLSKAAPADMAAAKDWAVANGVSDGSNPTGSVSRQQMAAMLYRYGQKFCNVEAIDGGAMGLAGFDDSANIADYAHDAMLWACQSGIMQGNGSKLNPTGNTTRAQFAVMLNRFAVNVIE